MANEREKTAQQVILEVGGEEYTLEYNRKALKQMEAKGFSMGDLDKKILTSIDLLIEGALWKNHKNMTSAKLEEVMDGIYEEYDVQELSKALMEMFASAVPDFANAKGTEKKVFKIVR